MSYNSRRIMQEFHNYNNTTIKFAAESNIILSQYITESSNENGEIIIRNKEPGCYNIYLDNSLYLLIINEKIDGANYICVKEYNKINRSTSLINQRHIAYKSINGKISKVGLYKLYKNDSVIETDENNKEIKWFKINNTVNSYIDGIVIGGCSTLILDSKFPIHASYIYQDGKDIVYPVHARYLSQSNNELPIVNAKYIYSNISPYTPLKLNSINHVDIISRCNNKTHKLPILFKNNIKSLPSGVRDVFVLDSINQKAFIIFNIGRVIFSGAEDWKLIYHNNNYATYFLKQEYVHVGEDDNSILCNYFPSVTNSKMLNDNTFYYGISNSNDDDNRGFYIRIPIDLLEEVDVTSFKKFLRNKFTTRPVVVEYLLHDCKYKSVLLDEYHIKQFYPYTEFYLGDNMEFAILNKIYGNNESENSSKVLQFTLQSV